MAVVISARCNAMRFASDASDDVGVHGIESLYSSVNVQRWYPISQSMKAEKK